MSCFCNQNPCSCDTTVDPNNEPLSSALNNFITAFFGTLTKTVVNNQVVWILPCDLDSGIAGYPRMANEGVACYLLRIVPLLATGSCGCAGQPGYTLTTLTNSDYNMTAGTQTIDQQFNGTLTGPVNLNAIAPDALQTYKFSISLDNVVTTNVNTLTITNNGVPLAVFADSGTLSGFIDLTFNGTDWVIMAQNTNIA